MNRTDRLPKVVALPILMHHIARTLWLTIRCTENPSGFPTFRHLKNNYLYGSTMLFNKKLFSIPWNQKNAKR